MRLFKKLLLGLLGLLIISQIPFAYRRYKLGRLNAAIQQLNSQRVTSSVETGYNEYKGVLHVHSFLGGHSAGSFQEIIEAAKANGLQFVVMTEHPSSEFNTAAMTLKGSYAGVLFVNGNEVGTHEGDRLLIIPGDEVTGRSGDFETRAVLEHSKIDNQLAAIAYPVDFKGWDNAGYEAVEIYNVYTNARRINPLIALCDTIWSFRSHHDLLFASFYARPSEAIAKWDQAGKSKRLVGLAGNDSHANVGLSLNDSSGKTLLGIKLDPYETSFHLVRVHVLIPKGKKLEESTLVGALKMGHCFIGFDLFGDTEGFSFSAGNSSDQRIQGDEIALGDGVRLRVSSPIPARILLFKDGSQIQEAAAATSKDFDVKEKGSYRVELYLPQLGHPIADQPWIISNPVHVK